MTSRFFPHILAGRCQKAPPRHRTWAEVDLTALAQNFCALKAILSPKEVLWAVIKADAYGHGLSACVAALRAAGCRHFAVATLEEGISARKALGCRGRDSEILVLGHTPPSFVPLLCRYRLTQTLLSPTYALSLERAAANYGRSLSVHIAIDTGMNRLGFLARSREECEATAHQIARVCRFSALQVTGMFTHLANPGDHPFSQQQIDRYRSLCATLKRTGCSLPLHHVYSSAGILTNTARFDGVRAGLALYGVGPAPVPLLPVMKLKTKVIHLHPVPAGEQIGYGGNDIAPSTRMIATLPIGYADGLPRNTKELFLTLHTHSGDRSCPIVGRICMDLCMMDVTGTAAALDDTVTIFGDTPDQLLSLSKKADTIPYEILTRISPRVPRIYR